MTKVGASIQRFKCFISYRFSKGNNKSAAYNIFEQTASFRSQGCFIFHLIPLLADFSNEISCLFVTKKDKRHKSAALTKCSRYYNITINSLHAG